MFPILCTVSFIFSLLEEGLHSQSAEHSTVEIALSQQPSFRGTNCKMYLSVCCCWNMALPFLSCTNDGMIGGMVGLSPALYIALCARCILNYVPDSDPSWAPMSSLFYLFIFFTDPLYTYVLTLGNVALVDVALFTFVCLHCELWTPFTTKSTCRYK